MKKHFLSICLFMMVLMASATLSNAQNNGNGNGNANGSGDHLIGRATGAFNSGCSNYNGPMNSSVSTVGICFVSGFITRVTFYPQVNCQQVDCNLIRFGALGNVDFDCEGNVIGVTCNY